ncbi:DUF1549 and DUF1553 domain-containing protein [Singulisphaera sp. PoT]|uniref:DUF1549 and DUF1553 domain-containing protein n=1 Tax=Singulisphaera sp. PoT TaxID=3411797 RepID=UPI003BF4FAF3
MTTALITVPKVGPILDIHLPDQANLIDRHVFTKLRELGIPLSRECTDDEFARRSSLDICGRLPDSADVAAFRSSQASDKRSRWVDQLLALPEYADYFALKWGTILRNKRTLGALSQPGTFAFHSWIRQAIAENLPYHEFVKRLLMAQGDAAQNPAVIWYRRYKTPEEVADDFGQLFLGLRLQCARCHHHPTDRWSTADYYGYASFFARIGRKPSADPTTPRLFVLPDGSSIDPSTGLAHQPRLLGTPESVPALRDQDPRRELADWLGKPENPYFARAVVNRYWKHFFGRGLVEPEDDFRKSQPPSHPELLDDLAADFVQHNYDLKRLVRTITTSRTYDRSSLPEPSNRFDRRYFARYYSRQLSAEVLMDAIAKVTEHSERFEGMPPGLRAVQLPDDGISSEFLDTFGRPKRETVCECERASEPNLNQGLLLLGSVDLQRTLAAPGGRAQRWLQDPRDDRLKVEELYEIALGRRPLPEELSKCLDHLHRRQGVGKRVEGYEDLLWAIINTKEFLFNH